VREVVSETTQPQHVKLEIFGEKLHMRDDAPQGEQVEK
jgi:hypothetical protein